MPTQSTSEVASSVTASTAKHAGNGESLSPDSHEYTICLLGDWTHAKTSKSKPPVADNSAHPSAVHEIAADFDSPIVQVSCGSGWGCLLCDDGRAYSFGDNTYGQLGQGHDRPHAMIPMLMSSPFCLQPRRRILRLSCGSAHGGFVLDVGDLYMFGSGSYGRLGTGDEDNVTVPTMVTLKWSTLLAAAPGLASHRKTLSAAVSVEDGGDVRFTDVSCGDRHTLALAIRTQRGNSNSRRTTAKSKTGIISFGDGMNGRLGLGDEKDRFEGALLTTWLAASNVPGVGIAGNNGCMTPPTITAICAGSTHNLALSATGDVFSWGNGVDGQLGHGDAVSEWVPRQIAFFKDLAAIAIGCGTAHSAATSRTGVVYTWGRGAEGQLGLDLEGDSTIDVVDKSVWVPHPVGILKGSAHRVSVRTMVAKQNMTLALDDRDRMFVWGDNSLEQLGLPLSANTQHGTKSFLPKPRLLAYMDLRAPKSATCGSPSSLSRVYSLRELVAAAKPDPIRLGLAHIDAGDRFTMLVFTTKPGISSSSNSGGCETRETTSRTSPEVSPEANATGASVSTWNFSLMDEFPPSAIPSREPAYYQFMLNYKVYIRPTIVKASDDDEESEADRELLRRSPRRRECRRSTSKRGSLILSGSTAPPENRDCRANSDVQLDDDSVSNSPAHVQGFDSWLDKRLNSPSKTGMAGHSFTNTPRFSTPSKDEEMRSATFSSATHDNGTSWTRSQASFPVKPQKPKSGFGRSVSIRRPTSFVRGPSSKIALLVSSNSSPANPLSNQEASPKQSQASKSPIVIVPFGSSVESRFGPSSSASSSTSTPIYPEKCSLRDRRAPQFTMGNADHFSLVISRRLHHAKGPGPGPGTYDRHGG